MPVDDCGGVIEDNQVVKANSATTVDACGWYSGGGSVRPIALIYNEFCDYCGLAHIFTHNGS
jgi:hypothetical protein